jgi:hypothetical protein
VAVITVAVVSTADSSVAALLQVRRMLRYYCWSSDLRTECACLLCTAWCAQLIRASIAIAALQTVVSCGFTSRIYSVCVLRKSSRSNSSVQILCVSVYRVICSQQQPLNQQQWQTTQHSDCNSGSFTATTCRDAAHCGITSALAVSTFAHAYQTLPTT